MVRRLGQSLADAAFTTSLIGLILSLFGMPETPWAISAALFGWTTAVWIVVAFARPWPELYEGIQIASTAAIGLATIAFLSEQDWYLAAARPWLDPWFALSLALVAAGIGLFWTIVRYGLSSLAAERVVETVRPDAWIGPWRAWFREYLNVRAVPFETVCVAAALVVMLLNAIYAVAPGIGCELSPVGNPLPFDRTLVQPPPIERFAFADAPHAHAQGPLAWGVVGLVAGTLIVGLRQRGVAARAIGLLFCAFAAALLMAANWEADNAVASAVRWSTASLGLLGFVAYCLRDRLPRYALNSAILSKTSVASTSINWVTIAVGLLSALIVLPLLAQAVTATLASYDWSAFALGIGPLPVFLIGLFAFLVVLGVAEAMRRLHPGESDVAVRSWEIPAASLTLVALGATVVWMFGLAAGLQTRPLFGPEPGSFFYELGARLSYALPFVVSAAACLIYGVRERSSFGLFAAGATVNVIANILYFVNRAQSSIAFDVAAWIDVTQLNAGVLTLTALIWGAGLCAKSKAKPLTSSTNEVEASRFVAPWLLALQPVAALGLLLTTIVPAVICLFLDPRPHDWYVAAGNGWAWAIGLVALGTAYFAFGKPKLAGGESMAGIAATFVVALAALVAVRWDGGDWTAYHVLTLGVCATGWGLWAAASLLRNRGATSPVIRTGWPALYLILAVVVGGRAYFADPQSPWWTVGAWISGGLLAAAVAGTTMRRGWLWPTFLLWNIAATIIWLELSGALFGRRLEEFGYLQIAVTGATILVSLGLELLFRKRNPGGMSTGVRVHDALTTFCMVGLGVLTCLSLFDDFHRTTREISWLWPVGALAATAVGAIVGLWDRVTRTSVFGLYSLGLIATAMFVDAFDVGGELFTFSATLALAAFTVATAYLWSIRDGIRRTAIALGIPANDAPRSGGSAWIVSVNGVFAVLVTAATFYGVLTFPERSFRTSISYAILRKP
ncbi:MAG: hypothetical protein QM811_07980 [Pirellulales bacterium]